MTFKQAKTVIREALRDASDAKLVATLSKARDGALRWFSCCCFADLIGFEEQSADWSMASNAYYYLASGEPGSYGDARRQRILAHMVLAEIWRRNRPHDNTEALRRLAGAVEDQDPAVQRNDSLSVGTGTVPEVVDGASVGGWR